MNEIIKRAKLIRESDYGTIGLGLVLFWVLIAIIVPILPLHPPNDTFQNSSQLGMFTSNPQGDFFVLGTDHKGRDLLSRMLWGSQRVLVWATLATVIAYIIGMALGVASGYLGRAWDEGLSFLGNVLLSFPVIILYIVIITFLGASGINIVIAVTFASAPGIMRIVRGLVLDIKTRDYVAAAQARGESSMYIMFIEILPNARGPLVVDGCLRLGYTTITIALLGYLGLGLPPPDPDWGQMISEAQGLGPKAGKGAIIPALALSSLVLGFNMLADGLREISLRD